MLETALSALVEELKQTEEFINYKNTFAAIENDEQAMRCVDDIRKLNMRVQEMGEEEYERESENLAAKMEELCSDARVADFIMAEVDFSKLYQHITDTIIGALD